MANVATNNTDITPRPLMDRLTHAVIKETSKSLKYYIDVKRRENAFVLNPNSSLCDSPPLRAKFVHGITKDHLSLNSSYHTDKDIKNILPHVQQKQKQFYSTSISPEKQMCREELNFHMRSYNFSPRETSKFSELRLKSTSPSSTNRDVRPRSTFKLTRHEQNQLIDDTADILASMVKSRRSVNETNLLTQQPLPIYISRNPNPSPRQLDDQTSDLRILTIKKQPKRDKHISADVLSKATSIMQKSKLINKGFLCEYKISITTGNCNGASTNAPIRIKLYGTNGHTNFQELVHSETHHVPFLKDQTDLFILKTYHVGELVGITIGHDRKDMRASWFLNKISIVDPIRHITYAIPCNVWLSIKSNDQKTMRDFPVVSMISNKKKINLEHREDNESQSDYSTTITEHTGISNITNPNENDLLTDHKQIKKHRKQQHVSIGPTTIAKKPASISTTTTTTTIETHFNRDELLPPPPIPIRRIPSPILYTTSSDTEIEGNITTRTRSTTPTPSPTLNPKRLQSVSEHDTLQTKSSNDMFKRHSIDYDRPPARLEQRNSPLSISPERANQNKEENNVFSFFE